MKFQNKAYGDEWDASRPAWGGWIEIYRQGVNAPWNPVPPRMGRVD